MRYKSGLARGVLTTGAGTACAESPPAPVQVQTQQAHLFKEAKWSSS